MKHFKILLLFLITLFFLNQSCSKDDENDSKSNQTIEEELMDVYILQYELNNQFLNTIKDYTDEIAHQDAVLAWIKQRPDVLEVEMYDFTYYSIKHITGIITVVSFIKEAEDHASATRGGGFTDGTLRQYVSKTNTNGENLITNKNVLVLCPYPDFMYDGDRSVKGRIKKISEIKDQFDEANLDFKVTYKINNNADVEAFSNLEDYGFIILATHGSKTGVHVAGTFVPKDGKKMTEPSKAKLAPIDEKNKELIKSRYLNPTLRTVYSTEGASRDTTTGYELTFPYFATLGLKMDNSILYGGFCFSGYKGGLLGKALTPQGLKAYYGWGYKQNADRGSSLPISNIASWDAEKVLIDNLTKDGDTTGVAHLIDNVKLVTDDDAWNRHPNGIKKRYKENFNIDGAQPLVQWLSKNYRYEVCVNDNDPYAKANITGLSSPPSFVADTFKVQKSKKTFVFRAETKDTSSQYGVTIDFSTTNYEGVGTYPVVGAASAVQGNGWSAAVFTDSFTRYDSFDGTSGKITITKDCDTYVEGTFSFPLKNGGSVVDINNGEFLLFY